MTRYRLVFLLVLLVLTNTALAQESVDEIDQEVVILLSLNNEQALAYSSIMQQQRVMFDELKPSGWAQQQAFYQATYTRVKRVLTEQQYMRFVAYMDSFLESIPDDELLAME